MAIQVEVRLRVPQMKIPVLDENNYPIDHASMRFRKVITVEKLPKADEELRLETSSGRTLQSRVVRTDWDEAGGRFIVSCQYASRSITPDDYGSLKNDPAWEFKHLLE
jgi:hypothetical protein